MGTKEGIESHSLLFVCLGNICRSPMAKAVFDYVQLQKGNPGISFFTTSAGTGAYHIGEEADPRTRQVCKSRGVPLLHTAKQIDLDMALSSDMILAMDRQNLNELERWGPQEIKSKLFLLGDFDPLYPHSEVPDPYYGSQKEFEQVFDQLFRCSEGLLNHFHLKAH